jgi:hypothetical protein
MNLEDFKKVVAAMKERDVGTIFVRGERHYVWSPSRGWLKPGPLKERFRKKK